MKKAQHLIRSFLLLASVLLAATVLHGQGTVSGTIQDAKSGETLPGASVRIQDTEDGTVTDINGYFSLSTRAPFPITLIITYVGYDELQIPVSAPSATLRIRLAAEGIMLEGVDVAGSRISEERKREPLTIESMDIIAIKATPSASFYDGLGNLTGVDLTTASLGFKIVNTRGFNSTSPVRSLQIIDGVDNQSPGLNFSLGNFLGATELDILKVDMIQGAASPFYGPNAFNGVISMTTKDPFHHTGLSTLVKIGERALFEGAARWADVLTNKDNLPAFGYKLNFSYLRANDWVADNYDPVDNSLVPASNPGGFDAVNIYGDEFYPLSDARTIQPWSDEAGLGVYYRTGYREVDLVDYNTQNLKAGVMGALRLKPAMLDESPELVLASNFGSGTTVYQGDNRFSLRGIMFWQNRLELQKRDKYFVRIYSTNEHSGRSFDPYFTALRLQNAAKEDEPWSLDYRAYWKGNIRNRMRQNGYPDLKYDPNTGTFSFDQQAADQFMVNYHDSLMFWHSLARMYANTRTTEYYAPGTPEFNDEFRRITSAKNNQTEEGTLFYDRSALYHSHGEYVFNPSFLNFLKVGATTRLYRPNTDGTIFSDTAGNRISNFEYGAYAGAAKSLWDEKLTLSFTIRMDKNQNFQAIATPAASVVFNPAKDHFFRFSFSSALRNPTLADQYLYLNVGRAILAGNLTGVDSLITLESFTNYRNNLNTSLLEYFDIEPVRPERVKTFEAGYRGIVAKHLFVDAGYYYSFYNDFLGYNIGIDAEISDLGYIRFLQVYRYAANSRQEVTTQGLNVGLRYYWRSYMYGANYSWNRLNAYEDDPIIPAFNTPENKFNLTVGARNLDVRMFGQQVNNLGFQVNYKWIEGFLFEGSPQFTGFVPSYDLLDAQVNWMAERLNTTFKLGVTNLLNRQQFQTYGGPRIGRMAYISGVYEPKWK